ncbi:MAG: hypothetical protein CM15mP34_0740 [Gammaproteobacteria bacterium]|nr:MAG: hypothetical protein CM15mP34_0740 [Gammaproteobacteria bacterium]
MKILIKILIWFSLTEAIAEETAQQDFEMWSKRLDSGGILAIHDVYPNPEDGGRPPFNIYKKALKGGSFKELDSIKSLRILQKVD